jgi:outer membrane protein insertion porin family
MKRFSIRYDIQMLSIRKTGSLCLALLIALLLAVCEPGFASDLGEFIGRRVNAVEIVIEGTTSQGSREMRSLIEVAANQDYSPVRIRDSLARLHRSGLVSRARVEGTGVGTDGVTLRFVVTPQARIDNVIFEGQTIFPPEELRARLNELDPGERLSLRAVEQGVDELLAYYSARGYYNVKITSDFRLDPGGTRATVVYSVNPGEVARVSRYTLHTRGARLDLTKIKHALVEGQPFSQSAVREEIDVIRKAYLENEYLAVEITRNIAADLIENTVAVTITVESGPRVLVGVNGLELDEKTKREIFPFYSEAGVDDFTIEEGARRLENYAQREGYFFAEVTRPAEPDLSGDVARLDYVVDPRGRYRLSNIEIEGLDAIPSQALQDEMKSKEASFFPFFGLGRGKTSDDLIRQDSNLISKRLRELGYRRARVEVLRGVSPDGSDLIITFDVQQGPRSYIDQVAIRGNNVFTTAELIQRAELTEGDPLVAAEVSQTTDRLLAAYNTQGYAVAEVSPEIVDLGSLNGDDRVRLVFKVIEGGRSRIRTVNTRGAEITKIGRLERNFYLFKTGEWLRNDKLQDSERALYETNAFNSVDITSEPVGRSVDGVEERDVIVNLAEAKRYQLTYGFGYQSNKSQDSVPGLDFLNGARGLIQLTNTNMFGRLYTGSAQFRASQNELLGQLSIQNPRPFGTSYPMLISIFARRLAETSFKSDRYTASIQAEKRLSTDSIVYMSYSFERISNYDLLLSEDEIVRNRQSVRIGRIGPSYVRDTRDNFSDPTSGTVTLGSAFVASKIFGGNEQFVKLLVEHSRYYPLKRFRDTVYSVSGRVGLASPFGGAQTLAISERFFGGGARDLRGFGFEQAGPRDQMTGRPLGGNAVVVLNNELRFPILGSLGGTVFSDTGNVFARVRDVKPSNFTQTLGFGLRIKTPIGPVRFDLGFLVINKPDGLRRWQRHFSFGQTF